MSDIEKMAKDLCIDYISGMSMALAVEHGEKFDFFYDMFQCAKDRVRDVQTRGQMDKLVAKLYERRQEQQ